MKPLAKAGDIGATTRGRYYAVARPTRDVVVNLSTYGKKQTN